MRKKEVKRILSLSTGFAVNRFNDLNLFANFIKDFLKLDHIQLSSDFMMLNMNDYCVSKYNEKLNKILKNKNIKINSTFTGGFDRLNHLSHHDKDHQEFWVKWFKKFFKISKDFGANYSGSHLGIIGFEELKNIDRILKKRLIKNWHILSEYAYKINLKGLIWEPMSVNREFGEKVSKTKKILNLLNKNTRSKFGLCLDIAHGDEGSSDKRDYDPYFWLNQFCNKSPVIHLKQKIRKNHSHLSFTKKNNKKGIIDRNKVIKILNNNKSFDNELVLELNFKERTLIERNMRKEILSSVQYWKEVL